jgi:hypothetical protein
LPLTISQSTTPNPLSEYETVRASGGLAASQNNGQIHCLANDRRKKYNELRKYEDAEAIAS